MEEAKKLEEDDEFEEFEDQAQQPLSQQEEGMKYWEEDWDDEDAQDDFTEKLKQELQKFK